jgi:hypothetical protein
MEESGQLHAPVTFLREIARGIYRIGGRVSPKTGAALDGVTKPIYNLVKLANAIWDKNRV